MNQSEFIRIAKEHFIEVILPRIQAVSMQVAENLLVLIEGSVAYGFCDEASDVDLDYYIDLEITEDMKQQIRNIFGSETHWREGVRVSYGFGGEYWKIGHLVNEDMGRFWNEFNPYAVNNLVQAIEVWDPKNLLPKIKEKVTFYPEDMKKTIIRGLWITINDSGDYNVHEALGRKKKCEAKIYLYRAVEAMLRLTYILNDRYYPPTKWLTAGLKQLQEEFLLSDMLEMIENSEDIEQIYNSFHEVYNKMKQYMIEHNSIEIECIENYPCNFSKPFYIFSTF